jgi:WD40 repeat protein
VAVLPDGRVVSGGDDDRVRIWDPVDASADAVDLAGHGDWVAALAVLPDGRIVSGGDDGHIRLWDPVDPDAEPVNLGNHDDWVGAFAVLPDGRLVSGGDDHRVKVWDSERQQLRAQGICSVRALATGRLDSGDNVLVVAHAGTGFSTWYIADTPTV